MMAAIAAASCGSDVTIAEHNEKTGKKLFITGKGRCNLTNDCDRDVFLKNVVTNPRFLYSSVYRLGPEETKRMFEDMGLSLKTERGNRVFPVSDKSSDVIKALNIRLKELGVHVLCETEVSDLKVLSGAVTGAVTADGRTIGADAVILATGGLSYPLTGSGGSGLKMAEKTGHRIVKCIPSLTGIETEEGFCRELMGLSLKNVKLSVLKKGKTVYEEQGEMLFTHYGISGPLVLTVSSRFGRDITDGKIMLTLDLKPALTEEKLHERLLREFGENANKQLKTVLSGLLPQSMIPVFIKLAGVLGDRKVNSVTREERSRLVSMLKDIRITPLCLRGWDEAIITKGGVDTRDIDPRTMESKLIKGLYFAGEIIDTDALTGGFNLQIAWSTGYAAGVSAGEEQ